MLKNRSVVKDHILTEILLGVCDATFVDFSMTEVDSIISAEGGCDSMIPSLPKETCASVVSIGSSFGLSSNPINDINCKFIIFFHNIPPSWLFSSVSVVNVLTGFGL